MTSTLLGQPSLQRPRRDPSLFDLILFPELYPEEETTAPPKEDKVTVNDDKDKSDNDSSNNTNQYDVATAVNDLVEERQEAQIALPLEGLRSCLPDHRDDDESGDKVVPSSIITTEKEEETFPTAAGDEGGEKEEEEIPTTEQVEKEGRQEGDHRDDKKEEEEEEAEKLTPSVDSSNPISYAKKQEDATKATTEEEEALTQPSVAANALKSTSPEEAADDADAKNSVVETADTLLVHDDDEDKKTKNASHQKDENDSSHTPATPKQNDDESSIVDAENSIVDDNDEKTKNAAPTEEESEEEYSNTPDVEIIGGRNDNDSDEHATIASVVPWSTELPPSPSEEEHKNTPDDDKEINGCNDNDDEPTATVLSEDVANLEMRDSSVATPCLENEMTATTEPEPTSLASSDEVHTSSPAIPTLPITIPNDPPKNDPSTQDRNSSSSTATCGACLVFLALNEEGQLSDEKVENKPKFSSATRTVGATASTILVVVGAFDFVGRCPMVREHTKSTAYQGPPSLCSATPVATAKLFYSELLAERAPSQGTSSAVAQGTKRRVFAFAHGKGRRTGQLEASTPNGSRRIDPRAGTQQTRTLDLSHV